MGMFDNDFGGFFDFNGDGTTDPSEQYVGYKIIDDLINEDEDEDTENE